MATLYCKLTLIVSIVLINVFIHIEWHLVTSFMTSVYLLAVNNNLSIVLISFTIFRIKYMQKQALYLYFIYYLNYRIDEI